MHTHVSQSLSSRSVIPSESLSMPSIQSISKISSGNTLLQPRDESQKSSVSPLPSSQLTGAVSHAPTFGSQKAARHGSVVAQTISELTQTPSRQLSSVHEFPSAQSASS